MRLSVIGAAALFIGLGAGRVWADGVSMSGEYLETRTANVYIGACHANGEFVTTGREGMLFWNIQKGEANGVKLDGLRALAVLSAKDNLAVETAERRTVLYVDEKASEAQREALAAALKEKYAKVLGAVIAVKSAPIEYSRRGLEYSVRIPNIVRIQTTRYACDHCVMPHMIWYTPLVELKSSIVAMAAVNEYNGAPELPVRWRRVEENSSYVGEFSF